jgi:glutathione S-transferase
MSAGGILYSFRRCPYAIRARLALDAAAVAVEVREVSLKAKPPELLEASPKGTVPVLLRPDGDILEESEAIWWWALAQGPGGEDRAMALRDGCAATLLGECDGVFKRHLDGFRYGATDADRAIHREGALAVLRRWSSHLEGMAGLSHPWEAPGDGARTDGLDALGRAVLPFVRQFRLGDPRGWDRQPHLTTLQRWLAAFEASPALARVMEPPWAWRQPWHSPSWLYHLALEADWQLARRQGEYTQSTRGRSLAEVGFIHACWSHQVEATRQRFYGDRPDLRLLIIDPALLAAAAIPVRAEPAPDSGELFPHVYGALPLAVVRLALRWPGEGESPAP